MDHCCAFRKGGVAWLTLDLLMSPRPTASGPTGFNIRLSRFCPCFQNMQNQHHFEPFSGGRAVHRLTSRSFLLML